MRRDLAVSFLVLLALSLTIMFFQLPTVKADITETRTFTASTSDGYIMQTAASYSSVHGAATGTVYDSANNFAVGQDCPYLYGIYRGFVFFDTSAIPDSATIDSANVSLYVASDSSDTDFNVQIQSGQPTYPHDPLVSGDYYYVRYSGSGGFRNTNTISGVGYWNITVSETGLNWISKSGTTKLCLRSSNDIDETAPTGNEYVLFNSREQGTSYAAKLYVTYTISGENLFVYNVYGPYIDSPTGTVYNGYVNVTVYPNYNETQTFTLDGTGGTADSELTYFEQQPLMMTWNASNAGNYTRTIYFTDSQTTDYYIFIPNQDEPYYYYSFSIIDLQGITNGYLESRLYLAGEYRIVERQAANAINALPFIMQWSVIYKMRVVCDQGTMSAGDFTALNEANQNIIIPNGAFPTTSYGFNATVACLRMNSTLIQMNYTDNTEETVWVHLSITKRAGTSDLEVYSENNTASTVQVNWNNADPSTDYKATVTFYRNGQVNTYKFACPAPADSNNPFAFLPAPYCYAVAVVLTITAGLVFSYATVAAGAWGMTGLAGWFTWIGWLPQETATWIAVAFMGLISGLITIAVWKKQEREL